MREFISEGHRCGKSAMLKKKILALSKTMPDRRFAVMSVKDNGQRFYSKVYQNGKLIEEGDVKP